MAGQGLGVRDDAEEIARQEDEARAPKLALRGVVFLGNRKVELRSFPDPTPDPGEVVLEMKASGMCGSDLKFYRSPPGAAQAALGLGALKDPFIGGHEPCGVVVARGAGVSEREAPDGQRVMDHHYAGCGACTHCRLGGS